MVAKDWFTRQWRLVQYAAAGLIEGLCSDDDQTRGALQTPPESAFNRKGTLVVCLFLLFLIGINLFLLLVKKVVNNKNGKEIFSLDDFEELLNKKCFHAQSFSDWFESECIYQNIDISFQEQYYFYKMYHKLSSRYVRLGDLDCLPPGLENLMSNHLATDGSLRLPLTSQFCLTALKKPGRDRFPHTQPT